MDPLNPTTLVDNLLPRTMLFARVTLNDKTSNQLIYVEELHADLQTMDSVEIMSFNDANVSWRKVISSQHTVKAVRNLKKFRVCNTPVFVHLDAKIIVPRKVSDVSLERGPNCHEMRAEYAKDGLLVFHASKSTHPTRLLDVSPAPVTKSKLYKPEGPNQPIYKLEVRGLGSTVVTSDGLILG